MQPQQHFRYAKGGSFDRQPVVAAQRQFQPAAERCAVDDGDGWTAQINQVLSQQMCLDQLVDDVGFGVQLTELADVGAYAKAAGFGRADDQCAGHVTLERGDNFAEFTQYRFGKHVGAAVGLVHQ